MRAFILLALFPLSASAQYLYDYTGGPTISVTGNGGYMQPPSQITGSIELTQPLPMSGTTNVSADLLEATWPGLVFTPGWSYGNASYTFTTQAGAVTGFSFDQTAGDGSHSAYEISGDSGSGVTLSVGDYNGGFTETAGAGSWVDPPLAAPEIDPAGGGVAIALLLGCLAILRGRHGR